MLAEAGRRTQLGAAFSEPGSRGKLSTSVHLSFPIVDVSWPPAFPTIMGGALQPRVNTHLSFLECLCIRYFAIGVTHNKHAWVESGRLRTYTAFRPWRCPWYCAIPAQVKSPGWCKGTKADRLSQLGSHAQEESRKQ